jgi:Cu/Ag efflux protein CusF
MNKNSKIVLLTLAAMLLLCPAIVFSQEEVVDGTMEETMDNSAEEMQEEMQGEYISGTVFSIDEEAENIVLQYQSDEDGNVSKMTIFYFSPTMEITKNGETMTPDDLKEGDKVSVEYTVDNESNKVINVLVVEE